jgi:hypothetical protein
MTLIKPVGDITTIASVGIPDDLHCVGDVLERGRASGGLVAAWAVIVLVNKYVSTGEDLEFGCIGVRYWGCTEAESLEAVGVFLTLCDVDVLPGALSEFGEPVGNAPDALKTINPSALSSRIDALLEERFLKADTFSVVLLEPHISIKNGAVFVAVIVCLNNAHGRSHRTADSFQGRNGQSPNEISARRTRVWAHPAWQWKTKTPLFPTLRLSEGLRSSWAGQQVNQPLPAGRAFLPPKQRASSAISSFLISIVAISNSE